MKSFDISSIIDKMTLETHLKYPVFYRRGTENAEILSIRLIKFSFSG